MKWRVVCDHRCEQCVYHDCITCTTEKEAEYYRKNPEELRQKQEEYFTRIQEKKQKELSMDQKRLQKLEKENQKRLLKLKKENRKKLQNLEKENRKKAIYFKNYYQSNKERIRTQQKEYRQANRAHLNDVGRRYYQANKEVVKQKSRDRYHMAKGVWIGYNKLYNFLSKYGIIKKTERGDTDDRKKQTLHRRI